MRACLEVNTQALKYNLNILAGLINKDSFFCPMIKANAYGHSSSQIYEIIKSIGIKQIGVISVEEALELNNISKKIKIYIFGSFLKSQIPLIHLHGFIPVVGQWEDLKNLACYKKKISFHVKFNLDLNRLGFLPSEVPALIKYIKNNSLLNLTGICSHLSEAEKLESQNNNSKSNPLIVFKTICNTFKKSFLNQNLQSHLLSSVGLLSLWSHSKLDSLFGFRPGICLYGVKPLISFSNTQAQQKYNSLHLKPVSCLKSFIVQTQILSSGESVSYGKTWTATKKSVVAVVSMGYADGLPYSLSHKNAEVLFRGERVPIVGRICMDFFMIDITNVLKDQKIKKQEEVIIFGTQKNNSISIEEQSKKANSISYELLTGLGFRVKRIFLNEI